MRRLVVSDIHGEGHRLLQVLHAANYNPQTDRLFLLGDYIGRGRDSCMTVEIVRYLQAQGATALLGNHDFVCLQVARHGSCVTTAWQGNLQKWMEQGGATIIRDYGGFPPDDVLEWINSLPTYHEEPDCILVHAGLRPGVALVDQSDDDLLWIRKEFHESYTGKRVIFGHTPTNLLHGKFTPWYGVDKIGIDTGSCFRGTYGGCLTLFDLDSHQIWVA